MKAIVLDLDVNKKPFVEMRNVPIPVIEPDEALIKIGAVSICGTDISIAKYVPAMQKRIKMPHILGHEFAGYIAKLGADVQDWKIGDYVSAETHIFCDDCPTCGRGDKHLCPNLKLLGVDRDGCFAEYVAVPAKVLNKNKEGLPLHLASIQENLGNAVYCVNEVNVRGKNILIIGDGPAALFVVAVARSKMFGAEEITLIGHHDIRLEIAEKMGAVVLNSAKLDAEFIGYCAGKDYGGKFDIVFEFTGSDAGINLATEACRPGGKIMIFGLAKEESATVPYNKIITKGIMVQGIYGREIWHTWGLVQLVLTECRDVIESIITYRFSFDYFEKGFELMDRGMCGKIVLEIN